MMNFKKVFWIVTVLIVAALVCFSAEIVYQNTAEYAVIIDGKWIEPEATEAFSHYVYNDALTLVAATPSNVILAHTAVSTSAELTTLVMVSEWAPVTVVIDVGDTNAGVLSVYFNATNTTAIPVTADWTYACHTEWFDRLYIANTATTTKYDVIIERRY
jgi:hypothetical protein